MGRGRRRRPPRCDTANGCQRGHQALWHLLPSQRWMVLGSSRCDHSAVKVSPGHGSPSHTCFADSNSPSAASRRGTPPLASGRRTGRAGKAERSIRSNKHLAKLMDAEGAVCDERKCVSPSARAPRFGWPVRLAALPALNRLGMVRPVSDITMSIQHRVGLEPPIHNRRGPQLPSSRPQVLNSFAACKGG